LATIKPAARPVCAAWLVEAAEPVILGGFTNVLIRYSLPVLVMALRDGRVLVCTEVEDTMSGIKF
jgi:hypothetical protein